MVGKAPKQPDPYQTAQAQTEANRKAAEDTLRLNSIDQNGVHGSSTFVRDENGLPTALNTSLSPALQPSYNSMAEALKINSTYLPTAPFDASTVPQGMPLADSIFNQGMNYLTPIHENQRKELDVNLTNRGLPIGSEARTLAEDNLHRNQTLQVNDLTERAIQATPQEEQRQLANALMLRNLPYQETQQNLGLLSAFPQPNGAAQPNAGISPTPIANILTQDYQSRLQDYQSRNAGLGKLIGAGASLAMAPFTGGTSLLGLGAGGIAGGNMTAAS